MKRSPVAVSLLGVGLFALALAVSLTGARAQEDNLLSRMHAGLDALVDLQPYVAAPERFNDPGFREKIQKDLDTLAEMKHAFPQNPKNTGEEAVEPGFAVISGLFSGYVGEVARSFREGENRAYIRNHVRTVTGLCLGCHTRMTNHISFDDLRTKTATADLAPAERLQFFAATRQYDKALAEFDGLLNQLRSTGFGYGELPGAVHHVLTIAVRVKHDPTLTRALIDKVAMQPGLPDFYARYVDQWKLDTAAWAKEKFDPEKATPAKLVARAKELIRQGETEQVFAVDMVGEIEFLRATRYLHGALDRGPEALPRASRVEAIALLGRCYAELPDLDHWGMDKLYFESCVRESPHTKSAKDCYSRYAGALATASQRTLRYLLDREQLERLKELKALAK